MKWWPSVLFLSLLSCGPRQYTAEDCKALASPEAFVDRCLGGQVNGEYVGDLKCWPFSAMERAQGVWLIRFEASEFFPKATSVEEAEKMRPRIWVETELTERPPILEAGQGGQPRAYLADVEGRMSLCDGWFGHLGQYPRQLIVERFHTLRPLRFPT